MGAPDQCPDALRADAPFRTECLRPVNLADPYGWDATQVFRAVVVVASELFHAVRRPRLTLEVNAVRLAVLLGAILPLMHRYGIEGVAVAVLLSSAAAVVLSLHRARSVLG